MKNKTYGYARVSGKDQNEIRQINSLTKNGVDENYIFIDKQSGKNFDRSQYQYLVEKILRDGDTLVITSIDRLGRNYTEIQNEWKRLTKEIGVYIRVLDMPLLDTSRNNDLTESFIADVVLQLLSYVAAKELEQNRQRRTEGINSMPFVNGKRVSSKTGIPTGRPEIEYPANWQAVYDKWTAKEISAVQAMQELNLKKNTFYKLVQKTCGCQNEKTKK